MARMKILFDGFEDLAYLVDTCLGTETLHKAVDEALSETGKYVQDQVNDAALPYAHGGHKGYATGDMYNALKKDNPVIWTSSTVAEVSVGFDLNAKGGFHSIWMMYGTPKIAKDQKLYNSIKGTKIQKEIAKIQENVMNKYISYEDVKG